MKIPATKIIITRVEGFSELCDVAKEFGGPSCWQDASSWLLSQGDTFPDNGSYNKHDFEVHFADGDTYKGVLDCQHPTTEDPDLDVAQHVRHFCEFHAGRRRPNWMDDETWAVALARVNEDEETRSICVKYLEEYDIPEGMPCCERVPLFMTVRSCPHVSVAPHKDGFYCAEHHPKVNRA